MLQPTNNITFVNKLIFYFFFMFLNLRAPLPVSRLTTLCRSSFNRFISSFFYLKKHIAFITFVTPCYIELSQLLTDLSVRPLVAGAPSISLLLFMHIWNESNQHYNTLYLHLVNRSGLYHIDGTMISILFYISESLSGSF